MKESKGSKGSFRGIWGSFEQPRILALVHKSSVVSFEFISSLFSFSVSLFHLSYLFSIHPISFSQEPCCLFYIHHVSFFIHLISFSFISSLFHSFHLFFIHPFPQESCRLFFIDLVSLSDLKESNKSHCDYRVKSVTIKSNESHYGYRVPTVK